MFTLTDTKNISCLGTSFKTLAEAKNYAIDLRRQYGLCESYSIGKFTYGNGHKEVYNSHKEIK